VPAQLQSFRHKDSLRTHQLRNQEQGLTENRRRPEFESQNQRPFSQLGKSLGKRGNQDVRGSLRIQTAKKPREDRLAVAVDG